MEGTHNDTCAYPHKHMQTHYSLHILARHKPCQCFLSDFYMQNLPCRKLFCITLMTSQQKTKRDTIKTLKTAEKNILTTTLLNTQAVDKSKIHPFIIPVKTVPHKKKKLKLVQKVFFPSPHACASPSLQHAVIGQQRKPELPPS